MGQGAEGTDERIDQRIDEPIDQPIDRIDQRIDGRSDAQSPMTKSQLMTNAQANDQITFFEWVSDSIDLREEIGIWNLEFGPFQVIRHSAS